MSRITQTDLSEIKHFNYIKYSTATTYKNKCLAAHNPITSRLLQMLMGYVNDSFFSIDSKVFNKIIDDIELREINLFKLISELKNQFSNNPKNLARIIFRINECYYAILLKKITNTIDQSTNLSKMDWYLSKADFNIYSSEISNEKSANHLFDDAVSYNNQEY